MSKRRRRYSRKPDIENKPAEPRNAADVNAKDQKADDGYVNSLAYLGEASPLQDASDYERHPISRQYELLTVLYRENWIAARIVDMPCEDMTRAWYSISSEIEQEKLDELAKLEAKHNVKKEITDAIRWGRLYGGAAAVMVIKGQEDMLDQPLDYDMIVPGSFRGLIVVDKSRGIYPSLDLEEDMDDPEFGYPKWYDVTLDEETGVTMRIHHSRILIFRGRMLPIDEEIAEDYWGAPELEHVYEELQKRNATSANIAQLVFQANVAALKMSDYGEVLGMGTQRQRDQVYKTIQEMNRLRTSFGLALMSQEDSYEQHPYSFTGVAEVYETFMMDMAGAAEIPATKLFGRAPQGMNATGESDMKNYYESIAQLQERQLRPALEKLLPVMCMSLWGAVPNDMEIVFEPLGTTTPSERADIMGKFSSPIIQAFSAGIITQRMALQELRESGKPINAWTNISDEDVEKASDDFDGGEMGGMEGMGGMPGMEGMMPGGPEGGMPPEAAQEGQQMPPEEAAEEEPVPQQAQPEEPEEATDGGPGSGNFNHPGYPRGGGINPQPAGQPAQPKAPIAERIKFIANPTAGMREPKRTPRTAQHVQQMNQERKDWGDLSLHQKVAGNAQENRHIAKVRRDVVKAAAKGDIAKAKAIVAANRHYWANDPESAEKVQSETLKRQKAVHRGFLHDFAAAVRRIFDREFVESEHPRGKGGKFVPKGQGNSSAPIDNEAQTSNNKSVKGWKGLKAVMEVGGPKGAKAFIADYLKKNPDVKAEIPKYMHVRDLVQNFTKKYPHAENFNTYDATTGEKLDIQDGFCVTFHQNQDPKDPLGGYTDEDYAAMCAIAKKELNSDSVNIGYYGNTEVSFICKDEKAAKEFAIKHNQKSVYNAATGRTLMNRQYDPQLNPIENA